MDLWNVNRLWWGAWLDSFAPVRLAPTGLPRDARGRFIKRS